MPTDRTRPIGTAIEGWASHDLVGRAGPIDDNATLLDLQMRPRCGVMVLVIHGLVGILASLSLFAQNEPENSFGRFQGHFVDTSGGAIAAIVRVVRADTNAVVLRFRANDDGSFRTGPLIPGPHLVTGFATGFRRRELQNLTIKAGHINELGKITLDLAGCDAPGTNCDYFGEVPNSARRIVAEAYITMEPSCTATLDRKIEVVCPERAGKLAMSAKGEISLVERNDTLFLIPGDGAAISSLQGSNADCSAVTYRHEDIAVVGLGPGVDFCVRTKRGLIAHVFFTDDVEAGSTSVALWYVTRKPR